MPIGVGVVGECDIVAVLEAHKLSHRIGAGTVHPDFAVVIDRHEGEGRIDLRIDHGDIQLVDRVNWFPVMDGVAPPSGSTANLRPAARMASISTTLRRSET